MNNNDAFTMIPDNILNTQLFSLLSIAERSILFDIIRLWHLNNPPNNTDTKNKPNLIHLYPKNMKFSSGIHKKTIYETIRKFEYIGILIAYGTKKSKRGNDIGKQVITKTHKKYIFNYYANHDEKVKKLIYINGIKTREERRKLISAENISKIKDVNKENKEKHKDEHKDEPQLDVVKELNMFNDPLEKKANRLKDDMSTTNESSKSSKSSDIPTIAYLWRHHDEYTNYDRTYVPWHIVHTIYGVISHKDAERMKEIDSKILKQYTTIEHKLYIIDSIKQMKNKQTTVIDDEEKFNKLYNEINGDVDSDVLHKHAEFIKLSINDKTKLYHKITTTKSQDKLKLKELMEV